MSSIGDLMALVNDNIDKPLNQQINDMIGLKASDDFYSNYYLLNKQYGEEENPSFGGGSNPSYRQFESNEIVVNTSGTIKIEAFTNLSLDSYADSSTHARINGYVEVYINNVLARKGEAYISNIYDTDGIVPDTTQHSFRSGINPMVAIKKGDKIKTITYLRVLTEKSANVRLNSINNYVSIWGTTVLRNNNAFIYGGDNNA